MPSSVSQDPLEGHQPAPEDGQSWTVLEAASRRHVSQLKRHTSQIPYHDELAPQRQGVQKICGLQYFQSTNRDRAMMMQSELCY